MCIFQKVQVTFGKSYLGDNRRKRCSRNYILKEKSVEFIIHEINSEEEELSVEDQAALDHAAAQPDLPFDLEEMAALAQAMHEFQAVPSYCERFIGGYFEEEE